MSSQNLYAARGLSYRILCWGMLGDQTMDWTTEAIERLKALWAEGHSTAEIGRRMGISKNAVVGKAHRLNLPARPSPIRRDAPPRPAPGAARAAPGACADAAPGCRRR